MDFELFDCSVESFSSFKLQFFRAFVFINMYNWSIDLSKYGHIVKVNVSGVSFS